MSPLRHFSSRILGQILQHANTKELHLRFTTGRWDAESWGERPWHGFKEGGTGVELWAWVEADTNDGAFAKWVTLTQSLSGLFCASLNFIDSTRTARPYLTFQPRGNHSTEGHSLHLLHGTLPGEVVCTENLTPFLKLLPCKGKAGISSLFDGHKLFDAAWQSMSIDFRPVCPEADGECYVEIEQSVDMVLDIDRSKRPRDNPIPRPVPVEQLVCDQSKPYHSEDTCYPVASAATKEWSLADVFGRTIPAPCPLSKYEAKTVCIIVPAEREVLTTAGAFELKNPDGLSRCYTLLGDIPFNLILPAQESVRLVPLAQPVLHAERTMVGHGQEHGGLRSILTNPSNTAAVDFVYFETLPWFMKPYLHTMKTTITSRDGSTEEISPRDIIKDVFYRPAIDRKRGTQLELVLSVPAASTVTLIYEFEKAILRYTEYPPDANRGFNVAPAVIRILDSNNTTNNPIPPSPIYLRTTSLLLPLPTPDFSMPYNVIILTSTVIALAFGNIFNLLVRRFVGAEEAPPSGLKGFIRSRIVTLKDKIRRKRVKVE
ncbi:Subunit of the glycosylphosphatidylinositol transamidase complex-like protein [Emydomyces testavorans]|uniref:Subunit of the glycosylphosphatidylinositol transamidase complex-like protein n=1 Tax=Emydomyces testavorans TaxID=2070801 RepID=A0AAF0IJJ2_9EURO|nr:Subunit of the glycosylphosphatidylinositol transamidase complex-like protein [Emydomyces testavorans]